MGMRHGRIAAMESEFVLVTNGNDRKKSVAQPDDHRRQAPATMHNPFPRSGRRRHAAFTGQMKGFGHNPIIGFSSHCLSFFCVHQKFSNNNERQFKPRSFDITGRHGFRECVVSGGKIKKNRQRELNSWHELDHHRRRVPAGLSTRRHRANGVLRIGCDALARALAAIYHAANMAYRRDRSLTRYWRILSNNCLQMPAIIESNE